MIGTGAISHKHAQAYKNIGYKLTVCTDILEEPGTALRRPVWREIREDLRRSVRASGRGFRGRVHVS